MCERKIKQMQQETANGPSDINIRHRFSAVGCLGGNKPAKRPLIASNFGTSAVANRANFPLA